jgi:HEAT repeat protein
VMENTSMKDEIRDILVRLSRTKDRLTVLRELNWKVIQWRAAASVRGSQTRSADPLVPEDVVQPIAGLLADTDQAIRREATWLLGQLGGGKHVPVLQSIATASDPNVSEETKTAACEALATIGGPAAVETLKRCTRPGNPDQVVYAAVVGLQSIPGTRGVFGPAGGPSGHIKEAIDAVAQNHPSRAVRLIARSMSSRL